MAAVAGKRHQGKQAQRQTDLRRFSCDLVSVLQNDGKANLSRCQSHRGIAEMGDAENRHRQAARSGDQIQRQQTCRRWRHCAPTGSRSRAPSALWTPPNSSNSCASPNAKSPSINKILLRSRGFITQNRDNQFRKLRWFTKCRGGVAETVKNHEERRERYAAP